MCALVGDKFFSMSICLCFSTLWRQQIWRHFILLSECFLCVCIMNGRDLNGVEDEGLMGLDVKYARFLSLFC